MKRVLTALVLIPAVVALVLLAPRWLFLLGLLPFVLLTVWEYLELVGRGGASPARLPVYVVAVGLCLVAAYRPGQMLPAVIGATLVLLLVEVARRGNTADILPASAAGVFGLFYIGVPYALMLDLRERVGGPRALLFLLVLVWVGDTAAYYVGRAIGRHKLAPNLSPGKTLEGTVASLAASVAVGFWLFRTWFGPTGEAHGLLLAIITNVMAQLGDLAESALKRGAGVKDSSSVLPGHGGLLDRVDALLFATPALWYYWFLLLQGGF